MLLGNLSVNLRECIQIQLDQDVNTNSFEQELSNGKKTEVLKYDYLLNKFKLAYPTYLEGPNSHELIRISSRHKSFPKFKHSLKTLANPPMIDLNKTYDYGSDGLPIFLCTYLLKNDWRINIPANEGKTPIKFWRQKGQLAISDTYCMLLQPSVNIVEVAIAGTSMALFSTNMGFNCEHIVQFTVKIQNCKKDVKVVISGFSNKKVIFFQE